MQEAIRQAEQMGHPYVGAEHVLLALLAVQKGVASTALCTMGIQLAAVREAIERYVESGRPKPRSRLWPFKPRLWCSPKTNRVIEAALQEAQERRSSNVGTEHILVALLRVPDTVAVNVLRLLGADYDVASGQIAELWNRGVTEHNNQTIDYGVDPKGLTSR
jgi:ATP-dependent Clp protease ATP-binding subunit ClpC